MRHLAIALFVMAGLLLAAPARADVPESAFKKLWARHSTDFDAFYDAKPRIACVCLTDPYDYRMGYIVSWEKDGNRFAACYVPRFADGQLLHAQGCGDRFEVLSR